MNDYKNALKKAKQKYSEYHRNYLHYDKMIEESIYESSKINYECKRNHCNDVMETINYIFGSKHLHEGNV